jgi:hypothetical protein
MRKRKLDENQIAFDALQQILRSDAIRDGVPQEPIPEPEKVSYRIKAGSKGGVSRSKKLSAKKRKTIARNAARARWSNRS